MHLKNFSSKVRPIFSAHMADLSEQTVIVRDNATKSLNSESLRSSRTFTSKAMSNFEPNFKVIRTTVTNSRSKLAKNASSVKK
jgi:ribosomal protein S24E